MGCVRRLLRRRHFGFNHGRCQSGASERTVGAALRGRPWFGTVFAKSEASIFEPLA